MSVEFSIIIPWRSGDPVREENLKRMIHCLTVQKVLPGMNSGDCARFEVILCEHARTNTVVRSFEGLISPFTHIVLRHDSEFNKSWCMNVAAKRAVYPHFLFMDADSIFGDTYLIVIRKFLEQYNSNVAFCWNYIICLTGKDNPHYRHIRPDTTAAMGGIWYAHKEYFLGPFGGMNEAFFGYGGEDNDAYERVLALRNMRGPDVIPYPLAHQYHDWVKPSVSATPYFEKTKKYPREVCSLIRQFGVGNESRPAPIAANMDQLQ